MRSKFLSSLLALPCGLLVAFSAFGQKVPVAEHVLSNAVVEDVVNIDFGTNEAAE